MSYKIAVHQRVLILSNLRYRSNFLSVLKGSRNILCLIQKIKSSILKNQHDQVDPFRVLYEIFQNRAISYILDCTMRSLVKAKSMELLNFLYRKLRFLHFTRWLWFSHGQNKELSCICIVQCICMYLYRKKCLTSLPRQETGPCAVMGLF